MMTGNLSSSPLQEQMVSPQNYGGLPSHQGQQFSSLGSANYVSHASAREGISKDF